MSLNSDTACSPHAHDAPPRTSATTEATELARLIPSFSASHSLSLASLADFFLNPTALNALDNALGAFRSSLPLHPNPVVSPIPPRRSLPLR
jgi:hypothetical protein